VVDITHPSNKKKQMVKTLDIFTDAAVTGADIGIGILTDENEYEKRFQYKTTKKLLCRELKSNPKSIVNFAELYAIYMALKDVNREYDTINIYTDSQTCCRILQDNEFVYYEKGSQKKGRVRIEPPFVNLRHMVKQLMKKKNANIKWINYDRDNSRIIWNLW
jgi:ribonuclease HI